MDTLVDVSSPTIDRVVSCSVALDPKIDRDVLWVDFVSVWTMDRVVSCAVPTMDRVVCCVSTGGADSVLPTRDTVAVVAGLPAIDTVVPACLLSSLWALAKGGESSSHLWMSGAFGRTA